MKIYLIRTIKAKGANFDIYSVVNVSDDAKLIYNSDNQLKQVIDNDTTLSNNNWYRLSLKPSGVNMDEVDLLPYFAKVTEDVPNSLKSIAQTYDRCQLTTQFPNNYMVFKDLKTGKELKIAMNSHTYEPIN